MYYFQSCVTSFENKKCYFSIKIIIINFNHLVTLKVYIYTNPSLKITNIDFNHMIILDIICVTKPFNTLKREVLCHWKWVVL